METDTLQKQCPVVCAGVVRNINFCLRKHLGKEEDQLTKRSKESLWSLVYTRPLSSIILSQEPLILPFQPLISSTFGDHRDTISILLGMNR